MSLHINNKLRAVTTKNVLFDFRFTAPHDSIIFPLNQSGRKANRIIKANTPTIYKQGCLQACLRRSDQTPTHNGEEHEIIGQRCISHWQN